MEVLSRPRPLPKKNNNEVYGNERAGALLRLQKYCRVLCCHPYSSAVSPDLMKWVFQGESGKYNQYEIKRHI
jgi:hypothetical protein